MAEETNREKSKNYSSLLKVVSFITPYKWHIIGSMLAIIITSAITLSIGQGLRLLVDNGLATSSEENLNYYVGIFGLLVLFLALTTFVRHYLVSWIGERVTADIREAVFNHVIGLHTSYFETNLSGEIQSRITTDTTLLQSLIGSSVSVALRNVIMLIGGVIWLFLTNVKLTTIIMAAVPFIIGPIIIFGRRVRKLSRATQDKIASVGTYVNEIIRNIKTVQAFTREGLDRQRFSGYVSDAFEVAMARVKQRAFLMSVVILLILGAVGAMLWVGGRDVMNKTISVGELAAFIFYAFIIATAAGSISGIIGDLQRAAGATERLMEILHAENLIKPAVPSLSLPSAQQASITIEDMTFFYETRPETPALQSVSLKIEPGQTTALVGKSGAGKTTLFDLLLRFYDPQTGVILLNGIDIRQLEPDELRRQIALVPQEPALFTGTVRDNILYGKPDASAEEMQAAAQAANASGFIEQMPDGYDSELGEAGVRLSGGQKQRIAIARAVLKDPAVLLLDEATSSLDAESEFEVQQALNRLMKGRTTLVIAHRLATVKKADSIVVLEAGQIIDQGRHEELLESSALYGRLARLQFADSADYANGLVT